MRDIRQDLQDRIKAIDSNLAALQEQKQLLSVLLKAEEGQWAMSAPNPKGTIPVALNGHSPKLRDIIMDVLENGESWPSSSIASVALKRGIDFGKSQPGRSVHFTLVDMARKGQVESAGYGSWRLAKNKGITVK